MPKRRRSNFWGDDSSGVERRHDRGMRFKDEVVIPISQFQWLVQSASDGAQQYTVEREEEVTDDETGFANCGDCVDVNSDFDDDEYSRDSKESYCEPCGICSCYYTCSCPDGHTLCKHVHKVHSLNKKLIKEQGPHTLKKSIEDKLAAVNMVGSKLLSARQSTKQAKEELYDDLVAVVNKYSNI